ncbi:MAG: ATP synthase F1 subunit delta [Gammaproteobacteria bacterium RIFCSPLOWO2_02_FULL_56_15]|nr:MAG: ATP synthase F1 subunit delta [Gammaproteobacteria bacterium RIFCSPLOWO2_02_FULL_56_15]
MAGTTTIARPYATAVFELARESDALNAWSGMLHLLQQVLADPQMQAVLNNPRVNAAALSDLIIAVCGDGLDDQGRNLVRTLSDAGRLVLAPEIYSIYEQQRLAAEGVVEMEILSAFPLEQEEQDRINGILAGRFDRKLSISTRIDTSLIGGVVIRVGDSVIDASIKGKLRQLGNELAG